MAAKSDIGGRVQKVRAAVPEGQAFFFFWGSLGPGSAEIRNFRESSQWVGLFWCPIDFVGPDSLVLSGIPVFLSGR